VKGGQRKKKDASSREKTEPGIKTPSKRKVWAKVEKKGELKLRGTWWARRREKANKGKKERQ